MLAKIVALIINEVVQEYKRLQPEPDHPDESVLSFSTALNPGQTTDALDMGAAIGFNKRVADG